MRIIFYMIDIFILFFCWKRYKDILNPIFITTGVWGGFVLCYDILCLLNKNYRLLSGTFYISVTAYIILFSIICRIIIRGVRKNTGNKILEIDTIKASKNTADFLLNTIILLNLLYIIFLFRYAGTWDLSGAISNIRNLTMGESAKPFSFGLKLLSFFFNFSPMLLCYIVVYKTKIKKTKIALLLVEMFSVGLLLATKGRLLRFFLIVIILLRNIMSPKWFKRALLFLIPISITMLYYLTMNRDAIYFDSYSMVDYLFLYLLSPLPALDRLLCGELSYGTALFGARTLSFIYNEFPGLLGSVLQGSFDPGYILVPSSTNYITTNVFTIIGPYFMDYNFVGIFVCAIVYSIIFGISYKKMRKNFKTEYMLFYLINVPYLIFQTFGDFIVLTFNITIQEFFSAVLMAYVVRKIHISSYIKR